MTLLPKLRIRSLGRSGKCSPPPEARNCSRKLPDFMFCDGSELPSRSRKYRIEESETLPPELRMRSLGRSGKCSPLPEARNCSRKLPDFMFRDGSELPSRSRNYYYA